eukprot:723184-Amphidinium_carterae.2
MDTPAFDEACSATVTDSNRSIRCPLRLAKKTRYSVVVRQVEELEVKRSRRPEGQASLSPSTTYCPPQCLEIRWLQKPS